MIAPMEISGTSNTDFVGTDVSPYITLSITLIVDFTEGASPFRK